MEEVTMDMDSAVAKNIRVYSGSAHPQLAKKIAEHMGEELGKVNLMRFPDGEIFCQFEENVRRADVFIIQPTCAPPNEQMHPDCHLHRRCSLGSVVRRLQSR